MTDRRAVFRALPVAVLVTVLVPQAASAERASPSQAFAAFERTLDRSEARKALLTFSSADRKRWRLTPGHRGGLMLSRMDKPTRDAAFGLLRTVLSKKGIGLIAAIREREAVLGRMTGNTSYRDPDKYYLAVFGKPQEPRWGLRFEGHHLSLNLTLEKDRVVSVLPLAIGSNPERLPESGKTLMTPVFKRAAIAYRTADKRDMHGLVSSFFTPFPDQIARRETARLVDAFLKGKSETSGGDYRFTSAGAAIALIRVTGNHLHMTLGDPAVDFGGS